MPDIASTALVEQIARLAKSLETSKASAGVQADTVEKLARAYRYLDGGEQPGSTSVTISK